MAKKLFIRSLSFNTTDDTLREACAQFGTVESVAVIMNRMTGRSKGFGFVEMASDEEAQAVIAGLNGKQLDGREVFVMEALPQESRPPRREFSRGGGGGGGGYRGDR